MKAKVGTRHAGLPGNVFGKAGPENSLGSA